MTLNKINAKGNILVTSIGSFSAECVVTSLRSFFDGKIFGCDIYPSEWHTVSNDFEQVFKSPLVKTNIEYLNFIKDTCEVHLIKVIIPLTDLDVDFFNDHRDFFLEEDILVTIGSNDFLSVARDKQKLNDFFIGDAMVKSIKTYLYHEISECEFPLIAKPKNGRSSEGIYYLKSILDVKTNSDIHGYIFQEVIEGKVCTVDYVRSEKFGNDFSLPRIELLRTVNGAGLTVQTFRCEKLEKIVKHIGNKLDVTGCINIEFLIKDDEYYLIDVNPRFSAGVGFSILAGYDFVKSHLLSFMEEDIVIPIRYKCLIAQKRMTEVVNKFLD